MAYKETKYFTDANKEYGKAQKEADKAYSGAIKNANKEISKASKDVDAAYSDINAKAGEHRSIGALKNGTDVTGQGVTQTSKLAESVNFNNELNYNNAARKKERTELSRAAIDLGLTNDANMANAYADNIAARMAARQNEAQFGYQYDKQDEDDEYTNAINTLKEFGKVMTKKQAKILGVPVGTSIKKFTSGSSGGRGGSSGGSISAAAQAVINSGEDLLPLYYKGFTDQYKGETDPYTAYMNQLGTPMKDEKGNIIKDENGKTIYKQGNTGVLGDAAVRDYLAERGITNEDDIMAIYAYYKIPYSIPRG